MEELYSEELRTPPLPLVALVGVTELHSVISSYLHAEPVPINTLALPDFSKVSVIGGKERKSVDMKAPPPLLPPFGILKIDWLRKHRTKVPAAVVVLLTREEIYGDPSQWLQVCNNLDTIKNVVRGRNTKLIVAIVQPTFLSGDLSEDRLITLRKRADVDGKNFITFTNQDQTEQKRSLARLGNILSEIVMVFYKEEGRRIKARLEKRAFTFNELGVRYNFKVAVYAEFRRDWVEVLKFYEAAYSLLQEVVSVPSELQSIQRLVELKTVAELLHFKISTLLVHGGKATEAVKWFRQHINFYKPLVGPSESIFLHWSWLEKQFLVFGDLLQNSPTSPIQIKPTSSALLDLPVTEHELQPGYYYQVAAHYVIERRSGFLSSSSFFVVQQNEDQEDVLEGPPEALVPPLYIGQSSRLLGHGNMTEAQCPTDSEYLYHAVRQERIFPHSATAITHFKRAYEQYKLIQASRMGYYIASEMGREYFHAREYKNAKQLFETVAGMYRQESWVALLWATLGFLRECARQLGLLQEYIEYSLEMASLPTTGDYDETEQEKKRGFTREVGPAGPLSHTQRKEVFIDLLKLLHGTQSVLPPREGETGLEVKESTPVILNIDLASPLRSVLAVCASFHDTTIKPGVVTSLTLSLLTHLPVVLDLKELEVHFNQSSCNFVLTCNKDVDNLDDLTQENAQTKKGYDLHLEPNKWKRFTVDIIPGESGKLECLTVTAHLGRFATIFCQVESPASRVDVLFWKFESQLEMFPMKDGSLAYFGQKIIQVEEPDPLVELTLEPMVGPALMGELFPVDVHVRSKGHAIYAGELKFSIVESSLLPIISSPRTPSPVEISFVELFTTGMVPLKREDDGLKMLAGVLMIPAISSESSFSTTIYMRFKEAKSVNVYASFSYQSETVVAPLDHPVTAPQFFVRRTLPLQCEEPFTLSHQFMPPFRRDALLGGLKETRGKPSGKACIAANETSTLMVSIKNSSAVKLELIGITVDEANGKVCSIRPANTSSAGSVHSFTRNLHKNDDSTCIEEQDHHQKNLVISPGESMASLFHIQPFEASPSLSIGTVNVKWRRLYTGVAADSKELKTNVTKTVFLPEVLVEQPSLLTTFNCPPAATVGIPFDVSLCIENRTALVQEVNFSVLDSPAFILSGAHSDTIHILPYAKDVISYRLISITSGMQQLPQFNLTATHYNAGFQQPLSSIQIFVFPPGREAK